MDDRTIGEIVDEVMKNHEHDEDGERKTIFIEKPVDRAVLVFQLSEEMTRLLPTEEYDALYEDLKKMVAAGVVLIPHGIECAGWVAPEGIVREETADCMPDTKEDW